MSDYLLRGSNITMEYHGERVLSGVNYNAERGKFNLITGPSGSGKTTLLNVLSGIKRPSDGRVSYDGVDLLSLSSKELTRWRAHKTGMIFQRSGLIGGLSLMENIEMPHHLADKNLSDNGGRITSLIQRLGIDSLVNQRANSLSGGEMQRAAIVRAVAHAPDIVYADEPTASLDTETKIEVHEILREIVDSSGVTLVMVSHDALSEEYAHTVTRLVDGNIANSPSNIGQTRGVA